MSHLELLTGVAGLLDSSFVNDATLKPGLLPSGSEAAGLARVSDCFGEWVCTRAADRRLPAASDSLGRFAP